MANTKTPVHAQNAPAAIGPYTPAVRSGDLLFTSGQVGFEPATGALVAGGIEPETEQVMQNLHGLLQAAGLTFGDVIKTTIYGKAFAEGVPPARSTVQVAGLPRGARVEIEAIARYPQA